MSEALKGLIGRLGALVPGYTGYAAKEKRRDTDQALRLSIAARLGAGRAALDRNIAASAQGMRFESLEALEGLKRRAQALADSVRHAPAGSAGLFSGVPVDEALLERIYAADLAAREACEAVTAAFEAVPRGGSEPAVDRAHDALAAAEEVFRRRAETLAGVR